MEMKEICKKIVPLDEYAMDIGNTTTSSAVGAVLLGEPVEDMTGRGAGLSSTGLLKKIQTIKDAIMLHLPDPKDPVDVISGVLTFVAAVLVFGRYYIMSKQVFGGITGDLAGYFLQMCELVIALAATITTTVF